MNHIITILYILNDRSDIKGTILLLYFTLYSYLNDRSDIKGNYIIIKLYTLNIESLYKKYLYFYF